MQHPNNRYISVYPKWINVRSDYVVRGLHSATKRKIFGVTAAERILEFLFAICPSVRDAYFRGGNR